MENFKYKKLINSNALPKFLDSKRSTSRKSLRKEIASKDYDNSSTIYDSVTRNNPFNNSNMKEATKNDSFPKMFLGSPKPRHYLA